MTISEKCSNYIRAKGWREPLASPGYDSSDSAKVFGNEFITFNPSGRCSVNFVHELTVHGVNGGTKRFYLIVALKRPKYVDLSMCERGPGNQRVVQYYGDVVPGVVNVSNDLMLLHVTPNVCIGIRNIPDKVVAFGSLAYIVPGAYLEPLLVGDRPSFGRGRGRVLTSPLERYRSVLAIIRAAEIHAKVVPLS